jgi:septum site-determining protein MinC
MANNKSFQLKGGFCTLTSLQILANDLTLFQEELTKTVKRTPKFFHHTPIIIDLTEAATDIDLQRIKLIMRANKLIPVGIRSEDKHLQKLAIQAGLAIFPHTSAEKEQVIPETTNKKETTPTPPPPQSKIITHPIRSGQQIYSKGDLIILSSVSAGAEILADGNIHVYGHLRGRALAGIMGETSARIFCQSLEAELVSVAGRYLVSEHLQEVKINQYTQVYLENNQLKIEMM